MGISLTVPLLQDLSKLRMLGGAYREEELEKLLNIALERRVVREHAVVKGEPYSARLILTHQRPGSIPQEPMYARGAASDLILLINNGAMGSARYEEPPARGGMKGWTVEALRFQNQPAALVRAKWIP